MLTNTLLRCLFALMATLVLTLHSPPGLAAPSEPAAATTQPTAPQDPFDFFSDKPVDSAEVVKVPEPNPAWIRIGGPAGLVSLGVLLLLLTKWLIPFERHTVDINLRNFPPAAKRGMAIAVVLFGFAFVFGASQIYYQLQFFDSSADYIASMSVGKLIVMTHAHLFGFTTAFFIVGIPFSMQFNHIRLYQWIFPIGLTAALIDVVSWWGIKFVDHSFEVVSMVCAMLFSASYLWMLIGLVRTLAFPEVIWASDKDKSIREAALKKKEEARKEFRKFFS